MNKKLILNLITLIITAFLLIFVINAWYVSNDTVNVNGARGETSNDSFTLDLQRGTYDGYTGGVHHWTWTSTKDLSINNMQPGDKFFFRFKVVPQKTGTYQIALGDISSSLQKDETGNTILTYENANPDYYVKVNNTRIYKMTNSTTLNIVDSTDSENVETNVLYEYVDNDFRLGDYLVQDVFVFYNLGKSIDEDYNSSNVIPSTTDHFKLDEVACTYSATLAQEFYIYFALEFNDEESIKKYIHQDGTVKEDSNLFLYQVLKIGRFELELIA